MSAGLIWLLTAGALGLAELAVPGVFLVFLAIAAGLTGAAVIAAPALPLALQLVSFAIWSGVTVLIGQRWYREYPISTADPTLNDPVARLIGQVVTVTTPIADGHGRVRVGDGEWPARGGDADTGARLRVVAFAAGTLVVEPLD